MTETRSHERVFVVLRAEFSQEIYVTVTSFVAKYAENRGMRRLALAFCIALLGGCAPGTTKATPQPSSLAGKLGGPSQDLLTALPEQAALIAAGPQSLSQVEKQADPDTEDIIVVVDGVLRSARVHTPTLPVDRSAAPLVPLVLALHGSDGSARDMESLTGYDDVADREGFIVAYADGLPIDLGANFISRSWNSGECCEPAVSAGVDDAGFLGLLLDRLIARYPVDPRRIFVVGHSNGAIMAQELGCRMADRIAGIASVSGALDDTRACQPDRPVPFLEIHGTYDQNVAWEAGEQGVSAWRQFNGCSNDASESFDNAVTTTSWSSCADGTRVVFQSIDGAEHPWPSRRTPTNDELTISYSLDATEATWTFFSSVSPVRTALHLG